jgi:hypothetical protein
VLFVFLPCVFPLDPFFCFSVHLPGELQLEICPYLCWCAPAVLGESTGLVFCAVRSERFEMSFLILYPVLGFILSQIFLARECAPNLFSVLDFFIYAVDRISSDLL